MTSTSFFAQYRDNIDILLSYIITILFQNMVEIFSLIDQYRRNIHIFYNIAIIYGINVVFPYGEKLFCNIVTIFVIFTTLSNYIVIIYGNNIVKIDIMVNKHNIVHHIVEMKHIVENIITVCSLYCEHFRRSLLMYLCIR